MRRLRKSRFPIGWILLIFVVAAGIVVGIPQIRERVFAKVDELTVLVRSVLFPVTENAFVPQGVTLPTVTPNLALFQPTSTLQPPTAVATATVIPLTPQPTSSPTATPTPLPSSAKLTGVKYESQNGAWNYCGPTNLAMLLSYWGWKGDKFTTGPYLKPFPYDYNVMPYEMVNYVTDMTKLGAVMRLGGTLDELKLLIANGFPVLVETGEYFRETATQQLGWMGHYTVLTAFNDANNQFIAQDSYVQPDLPVAYDTLNQQWRAFDFVFIVAYSQEKKDQLFSLLGDYADETNSYKIAYDRASKEVYSLSGIDQYFAWFNRGTAQVNLQDFAGAAQSYDEAFKLYPNFPEDKRPWRMLWYQTGPYFAYFYSGRYQDVVNLATTTLDFIKNRAQSLGISDQPQVGQFIEETWYWRGMARVVIGDKQGAITDYQMALKYHAGFTPAVDELKRLGVPIQ
jgi:tetratricopeptide (TPR) repeat protein